MLQRNSKPAVVFARLASHTKQVVILFVLCALLAGIYSYTRAQVSRVAYAAVGINRQINFQGKLVNPNGTNVTNGSYSIVFSIYTVSSGGAAIWTETQTPTVTDGIFQVNLGSVTALPGSVDFNTDNIYLGIRVGADAEMTPRIQFTAVPQAFNAERLGGLDKSGFIQNGTSQQTTASFNIDGTGTIGTSLTTPLIQNAGTLALSATGANPITLSTNGSIRWSVLSGGQLEGNGASVIRSSTGNITIASNGGNGNVILSPNGSGDLTVSTDTDTNVQITASAVPGVDMLSISNTGQAVTAAGVNAIGVNYVGGAAAVEAAAGRIDLQPGTTSGGTWSAWRLVHNATGPASGVVSQGLKVEGPTTGGAGTYNAINIANIGATTTSGIVRGINITGTNSQAAGTVRGIQLNNLTAGAASEIGIDLGTGWDSLLTYNNGATVLINGTGQWNLGQVSGTLAAGNGGTGNNTYTVGDLLYASAATTLSRLADVAVGSCLRSGGVGVAPAWGSCSSSSDITGSGTSGQVAYFNGSQTLTSSANFLFNGTDLTIAGDLAVNGDDITADGALTVNSASYVRIGDTGTPGFANGDDDLYVEGDLEVDANSYFDGTLTFGNTAITNDITLQNGETIDNDTDNRINLGLGTAGTLHLTSATSATLSNSAGQLNINPFNGTLATTATTFSGSSLATFTTAATLSMSSTTTLTLGSNATINGGGNANDDLTLQGTSNATRTSSYVLLQPNGGNVGIGTSTPNTALEVNGAISRVQNSTRTYKNVYAYNISASNQTGTIVLTAPKGATNTMIRFTIKGYDYSGNGAWEVVVSGYSYGVGPAWINTSAEIRGTAPFSSVRLAYDASNNAIILLGNTTTLWQYPKVIIEEIVAGHSSVDDWGGTWTGALVTDESAYSVVTTPAVSSPFIQGGNIFGATATLGTNDAQSLVLETNNTARLTITSAGAATFSGSLTAVGVNYGSGALNGTGGGTVSGTFNINNNVNSATNIGTGTSTGLVTIGGGAGTFSLQTTNIDISSGGAISGVTGYGQVSGTFGVGLTTTNAAIFSSTTANSDTIQILPQSTAVTASFAGTLTTADLTAARTWTLPDVGGTICTTGAVCAGYQASGSYANTALSNLASVNINAALNRTSGNLTLQTTTSGNIVLDGAGNIQLNDLVVLGSGASSITRTAAGITTVDLVDAANTTLAVTNSGAGVANITADGSVTAVGVNYGTGALTGTGGGTVSGAFNVNDNVNSATNIGTGTSTGLVTIGGGAGTFSLQTTNIDISSGGAISGVTGYTQASGNFAQNGTGTFATGTGVVSLNGATDIAASASLATKRGADFTTDGTTNDASLNTASLYRLDATTVAQVITGIAAGRDGQILTLINADAALTVTLSHLNAGSLAANRINTGTNSDIVMAPGASLTLIYDSGSSLWRVIGDVAGGTGLAYVQGGNSFGTTATLGTNDAQSLVLETAGSARLTITSAGAATFSGSLAVTGTSTFNDDVILGAGDQIDFDDATGDKVYYFSNTYGRGIESSTLTDWTGSRYRLRIGGTSVSTGTERLTVTSTGLKIGTGDAAQALDVTGNGLFSGSLTSVGVNFGTGALNGTGGGTVSGAFNINNNINSATNIGTGTSTSLVTIGGGAGTFSLQTTNIDISSGGAISGVTGYGQVSGAFGVTLTTNGAAVFGSTTANSDTISILPQSSSAVASFTGTITTADLTAAQTWTLPNETGTICTTGSVCAGYQASGSYATTDLSNIASTNLGAALNRTAGDLTIQTTTSGNILLNPAVAAGLVNVGLGNLKVGDGTPTVTLNGEDMYVEGTFEVDGAVRFDSTGTALTLGGAATTAINIASTGVTTDINMQNSETIHNNTNGDITFTRNDANSDTISLRPATGGAASFAGILTSLDLTAAQTWTLPNETGTICTTGSVCAGYQASGSYATTDLSNIASTNLGAALNRTAGDLTIQTTTSGNILLNPAVAAGLVNVGLGNLKVGDGTPTVALDGEDAYIEGSLEVDGTSRFDNTLTVAAGGIAVTGNSTIATTAGNTVSIGNSTGTVAIDGGTSATAVVINTGASGHINIGDNAVAKTIDIGGVTSSGTDTVNIATNGTAADVVTIGSNIAASTTKLQGGASGNLWVRNTGVGINTGTSTVTGDLTFGSGNRTINLVASTSAVGGNLTINAGNGNGAFKGGDLILQGGAQGSSGGTGSVIVRANGTESTTAFVVQNSGSTPLFTVNSTASSTRGGLLQVGSATTNATGVLFVLDSYDNTGAGEAGLSGVNGAMYFNTSSQTFRCYYNSGWKDCNATTGTSTVTLIPEYAGGVIMADLSNNSGTMKSDFVSGLASGQGYKHNYYEWSTDQATSQDYSIIVNYQLPTTFSSFVPSSFMIWTYMDSLAAGNDVTFEMYDQDGTACYASPVSVKTTVTAAQWQQKAPGDPSLCTFAAGDIITIVVKPYAITPQTSKIRIGEISFGY